MFTIDFFELMFLAETCIPPKPIARATFFLSMSDTYYNQMSVAQREDAFKWIGKSSGFDLANVECAHFEARFNPENQFIVYPNSNHRQESIYCYLWQGRYHTSSTRSVYEHEIARVEKVKEIKTEHHNS